MNFSNLTFALRMFFKNASTSIIATMVLAVGLALSISMYTLSHMIMWDEPNFTDGQLVTISWVQEYKPGQQRSQGIKIPDYLDFKKQSQSFENMAPLHVLYFSVFNPERQGAAKRYDGLRTDGDFFPMIEANPILGRGFTDEDVKNAEDLIVIGYEVWQQEFDLDPNAIGKTLLLDGTPNKVIGVMPQGFRFPFAANIWKAYDWRWETGNGRENVFSPMLAGKLKTGTSIETAQLELTNIAQQLKQLHPKTNEKLERVNVKAFHQVIRNQETDAILMAMLIGSMFVLFTACANVSNLVLARINKRYFELTMRKVLGASKFEICVQVFIDALLLAVAGGIIAFILASWSNRFIWDLLSTNYAPLPYWWSMELKPSVFLFGLASIIGAAVFSSIFPLVKLLRKHNMEALKDNSRTTSGLGTSKIGRMLVGSQILFTTILLISAGNFLHLIDSILDKELPYQPENILTNSIYASHEAGYETPESVLAFFDDLEREIESIPGIDNAGFGYQLFAAGVWTERKFEIEGQSYASEKDYPKTGSNIISPSYFEIMGGKIIAGRALDARDIQRAKPVTVVNQNFVNEFFPQENPIGKRIKVERPGNFWEPQNKDKPYTEWLTIVGVTTSLQSDKFIEAARKQGTLSGYLTVYLPAKQWVSRTMNMVITSKNDVSQYSQQVANAVARVSTKMAPMNNYQTIAKLLEKQDSFMVLVSNIVFGFAIFSLAMAATGLYGIASFTTQQKQREYGIHMALGAQRSRILMLVLKTTRWQFLFGIAVGCLIGLNLNMLLNQQMGADALNAIEYTALIGVAVVALISLVLSAAMLWPAWKCANTPPNAALRSS